MKTVLFDISSETASAAVQHIKNENADSLMVMAPFSGKMSMHAPSKTGKHKGYHRIKCEIWIPEDAIQGASALTDFGAFALLRLPLARVKDHLKKPQLPVPNEKWEKRRCECGRGYAVEQILGDELEEPACPECGSTYSELIGAADGI